MVRKTSDPLYIFLIIVVVVEFMAVIAVNALASLPSDPTGWFLNSTGDISDKYDTSITPAGWAFTIWTAIYIWQALWIVYAIANVCRTNKFGKVYLNPPTITPAFLVFYAANLVLNVAWLFVWDRQYIPLAAGMLGAITISAYICLWINHRAVAREMEQLRHHHVVDLWLNRMLVQNGITIYATWCTIATLVNLTSAIQYFADVAPDTACYITLSILTSILILYFVLDVIVWDKYLRSTFMVYPVVVWATTASMLNNWDPDTPISIYTAVIVGLGCAAFVIKHIAAIARTCRESKHCGGNGNGKDANAGSIGMNQVA